MTKKEAINIRKIIEQSTASLDDATASKETRLFPSLKYDGTLVKAGTRINWNGVLKRAAVDLWDTEENNPDNTPTMWEDINYKDGYRIIPDIITVGLAFKMDEYGWWKDHLYVSKIDNNVYTPDQYPNGWKLIK